MPEIDPVYYDAIDEVVDERKEASEWDEDEMRSALLEVAKDVPQTQAAEGRDFNQGVLSKRWNNVEERKEKLEEQYDSGSSLFRDPMEEAINSFEEFFKDMNEKYDMGVNSRVVQMMVDEIRTTGQLPAPVFLDKFLRETKSGVKGADVDYIRRRYEGFTENYTQEGQGGAQSMGGMDSYGGTSIQGRQGPEQSTGRGIPIGGQGGPPRQNGRGGHQQHGSKNQSPRDDRISQLEDQIEALTEKLEEDDDDDGEQMIKVEVADGRMAELPAHHPLAMQMLSDDDDDEDLLSVLKEAKEAGLVMGPEHLQEATEPEDELAGKIAEAIESLGERQMQAQQQMSANFQQAIESIQEMQEQEDDEPTMEEVEQLLEEKLTKSETQRLREEMDDKFETMMERVEESQRRKEGGRMDPEFLKTDREMQFREKQMETLNENLQTLPKAVATSVREGLVPAMKEMQYMGGDSGNPLFTPPGSDQRGQPSYKPKEVSPGRQRPQQGQQRRRADRQQSPQDDEEPAQANETEGAAGEQSQAGEEPEEDAGIAQESPGQVSEGDVRDVMAKLNTEEEPNEKEVQA